MFEGKITEKKAKFWLNPPTKAGLWYIPQYQSLLGLLSERPRRILQETWGAGFLETEAWKGGWGRSRAGTTLQWGSKAQLGHHAGSEATRATTEVSWEEAHEPYATFCKASTALNENWDCSLIYILNKQVQQVFKNLLFKTLFASATTCKFLGFLTQKWCFKHSAALTWCDQILKERFDMHIYPLNTIKRQELQLKRYDQFLEIQHFCGNLHFRYRDQLSLDVAISLGTIQIHRLWCFKEVKKKKQLVFWVFFSKFTSHCHLYCTKNKACDPDNVQVSLSCILQHYV